ncbi:hypothetical protein L0244_03945 [bacterium]|nr:hypothetical protein [bacterium]
MDAITYEIVQHISALPFNKKKAILELLKIDLGTNTKPVESSQEKWRKELLTTSVWTDEAIQAMHEAREFINQWKPQPFSSILPL